MKPIEIGILSLQGDIEEQQSATSLAFEEMGVQGKVTWTTTSSVAERIQGLIIPGGESTTIGKMGNSGPLLQTLKKRIENGLPTLGTCAGLIMLANKVYDRVLGDTGQSLLGGLDITVERNAFGRQRESFEAALSIPAIGEKPFRGVFIRSPIVKQVGQKVDVLAKLNERIVSVRQDNILGTSFHPELSGDARFHKHFIQLVSQNPLLN